VLAHPVAIVVPALELIVAVLFFTRLRRPLGTLPAGAEGKALPPMEEKGFFGRMLEKIGL